MTKTILALTFLFILNSLFAQDCERVFKDDLNTNTFELAKIKFDYNISENSVYLGMYAYLNEEQRLSAWKRGKDELVFHANDNSKFTVKIDYPKGVFISVFTDEYNRYYFPHIFVSKDFFNFVESHEITLLTIQDTKVDVKSKDSKVFKSYSKCVKQKAEEKNVLLSKEEELNEILKCEMIIDKIDEIEGYRIQKLGYAVIGYAFDKNETNSFAFVVNLKKVKNDYYLRARVNSAEYCLNSESSLAIKFSNDSIVRLKHVGDIDCGEGTELWIRLEANQVQSLKTNEIVFARIYSSDGKIDIPNIDKGNYFKFAFDCFE